jgi:hypothetical protein
MSRIDELAHYRKHLLPFDAGWTPVAVADPATYKAACGENLRGNPVR